MISRASAGLRHRVTIQRKIVGRAADGGQAVEWHDVVNDEPAAVVPLRGTQYFAASQVNTDVAYKIVVRYREDSFYTANMRVKWMGHILDIEAALEQEGRARLVELMCRERLPEGFRTVGTDLG